jgi:probable HAF family extracellular repeat protein
MSRIASLFGAVALAVSGASAAPYYHVEVLPPVDGHESVFPTAMEPGIVVGTAGGDRFDPLGAPVIWDGANWMALDKAGSSSFALGLAGADLIVGTSANEPAVWRNGRRAPLAAIEGMPGGFAHDANRSGVIAGSVVNDLFGIELPAAWNAADGAGELLRLPRNGNVGTALAVNAKGEIAGSVDGVPVVWPSSKRPPRRLPLVTGAIGGEILDLNDLGDAVGRAAFPDGSSQAMALFAGDRAATALGTLGGTYSTANGVNALRQVVGASSSVLGARAFVWEAGTMTDLNTLVSSTSEPIEAIVDAVAIDDAGAIAAQVVVATPYGPATRVAVLTPVFP